MRAQLAGWLLLTSLLTGCATGDMRDLARRADAIEISTAEAEVLNPRTQGRATAVGVGGAAGVGAAAGLSCGPVAVVCSPVFGLIAAAGAATSVMLDGLSASRTRALAARLQAEARPATFIEDVAARARQHAGPVADASAGSQARVVLAVSRLELRPSFPAQAQLLVWVEARIQLTTADGVARDGRQRYVHAGTYENLDDLERKLDVLARVLARAREDLARQIARDLRR